MKVTDKCQKRYCVSCKQIDSFFCWHGTKWTNLSIHYMWQAKKNKFWSGIKVEIFRKELTNICIFKTDGLFMSQDCSHVHRGFNEVAVHLLTASDRPWVWTIFSSFYLYALNQIGDNLLCYSIIICFCIGCLCFIILSLNVWVANERQLLIVRIVHRWMRGYFSTEVNEQSVS